MRATSLALSLTLLVAGCDLSSDPTGPGADVLLPEPALDPAEPEIAAAVAATNAWATSAPVLAPDDVKVTEKVLGAVKGPKIRIGKYKKRTGYRRHTGFRASLTQIEIESIGGKSARAATRPKAQPEKAAKPATTAADLPAGYADMTIADIKAAAGDWNAGALEAALAFERDNANRKGAIAALESVLAEGGES